MVKKQVFELLSALCVYSQDGYRLSLEALDSFKTIKKQRYRFSIIVNELRTAELTSYKTTVMAFINCILVATEDLHERIRIRNEFIGLNLLDLINNLRNEDDEDLIIQCDVFDDEKQSDDDEFALQNATGLDINDHKEVFNVYNTPQADILLLDTKRSMNINIFLKQFKCSHAEIISLIVDGATDKIGPERLRGLQKILPTSDEIALIKGFDGDKEMLGNAEKFYLCLSGVSAFALRIEGMVLKDDFRSTIETLRPNLQTYIRTCSQLMENESMKVFLRYVLHTGNFLNA
ncbi:hypothetical protein KUTeg_025041, partial [Tegillarca granosa]